MDLTTFLVGALAAIGAMLLASPDANADRVLVEMELCQFEDGNRDGKPCLWVDPDTRIGYVVDSSNYR